MNRYRNPNTPPTRTELQQYIHKYKLESQQSANEDMDKFFDYSNKLEQKLSSDLIVFASVILTITGSIIAAREIRLSSYVKIVMATGFVALLISILSGLASYRSMSDFWLKWAKAKHERGGMIEMDKSKTYDDLVDLRKKMTDHEAKLPQASPKLFSIVQTICFIVGILLVTVAIISVMFNFDLLRK